MNLQTVSIIIIWLSNQSSVACELDHQDELRIRLVVGGEEERRRAEPATYWICSGSVNILCISCSQMIMEYYFIVKLLDR